MKSREVKLINHENLTGFNHNTIFIYQLVNVNAAIKFFFLKIDGEELRNILILIHLFAY